MKNSERISKRKKCLVTGGAGFLGSHLVDRLIREGYPVVVIDNLSSGRKQNLNKKSKFYKIDVRNPKISEIFRKEKPKIVFHFAAHIEARESVKDPIFDAENNILGSLNVLENCRKFKTDKIIFASSGGEIYGAAKIIPTPEGFSPSPISPYGVGKLAVEGYLKSYSKMFNLSFISLRYGNIYGPRQNPYGEAGVVAIFANKMFRGEQPFIHGNGRQTKDYIFIDDAIEATILSLKNNFEGIMNVATGKETSVMEIFNKIKALTYSKAREKHVPLPVCSFERGALSIRKAKRDIGWRPKYSLEKGLEKTVDWFRNNSYGK